MWSNFVDVSCFNKITSLNMAEQVGIFTEDEL